MNQRVIKFRAWHKADKQILPVIGLFYNPDTMQLMDVNVGDSETVDWRDQSDLILMQYTGLNDKYGREIYEGDIMQSPEWGCVVIRWLPDLGCFGCWHPTTGGHDNLIGYSQAQVIGNIYQNPELLQQ